MTTTLIMTEYGEKSGQAVRVFRTMFRPSADPVAELDPHHHTEHQLVLADSGGFLLQVGDAVWTVPAGRVGWIPAGSQHDAVPITDSILTAVHIAPPRRGFGSMADTLRRPGTLVATGTLQGLVRFLARPDLDDAVASLAADVLVDAAHAAARATPLLAVPRDPAVRTVARSLLADPADDRPLRDWAALCFVSERTLQRAFVAETGLGFRDWRATVRLAAARVLLGEGRPVHQVAARVGFSNTSSFVAAFRRHHGLTPGRHRHSKAAQEAAGLVGALGTVASDLGGFAPLVG